MASPPRLTLATIRRAARLGLLALAAVFLKKAAALILVPIAMLFGFFKKLFRKNSTPPSPTA